jgi:hypothetical protein
VLVVLGANARVAVAVRVSLRTESQAVGCCARCRVGHGDEGDNGADDDRGLACAACADERVALVIVGLHADCRQGKVGTVDCDNGRLGKSSAGVNTLNSGVDRDYGGNQEQQQVDLHMSA